LSNSSVVGAPNENKGSGAAAFLSGLSKTKGLGLLSPNLEPNVTGDSMDLVLILSSGLSSPSELGGPKTVRRDDEGAANDEENDGAAGVANDEGVVNNEAVNGVSDLGEDRGSDKPLMASRFLLGRGTVSRSSL
jgi:hypothetical protein